MEQLKIGDKVRTKPNSYTRVSGIVTALHRETVYGHSACASIYCGKYESVQVPLTDLIKL